MIKPITALVTIACLAACVPEDEVIRQREKLDDSICTRRGGDYDKCRASVVEERKACLERWYALPPEVRRRMSVHPETRTPEIRACAATGF